MFICLAINRYIAPEQVPVQFGGLSREGEQEFTVSDSVTEVTIKAATKHTVEFPVSEVRRNICIGSLIAYILLVKILFD